MKKVLALLAFVACAPKDFTPSSLVSTLRVLAVRADKPFAAPGENVQLEALVVDPRGNGRDVRFAFGTCVNPGSGEIPDCVARLGPLKELGVMDESATFGVDIPANALTGLQLPVGTVGVVFAACAGKFVDQPRTAGAPIGCSDDSRDSFVWGMKRITVIDIARNQNPEMAKIFWDGGGSEPEIPPFDPCTDEKTCLSHTIDIFPADGAAETYPDPLDLKSTRTEDLVMFFFATDGKMQDEVVRLADPDGRGMRFTTRFEPLDIDPKKPIDFWFVLRDDRGGMSFAHRTMSR